MNIRLVFMGSPEFAVPSLRALAKQYTVTGVVTQPDRPAGRGRALAAPPVKELALALGLPLIQPERLRQPDAMQQLQAWAPDLIVVAAFGQILRPAVLDLPRYGCINVHASLLPRWRGAAPIAAAILHGDAESGISIMRMDPGVDTGPVLSQRSQPIRLDDTTASLGERMAEMGAALLLETLPGYLSGTIQPVAQDETQSSYAPMLKKDDGLLDFSHPAEQLERQVRAFTPWPGASLTWQEQPLKLLRARVIPPEEMPADRAEAAETGQHTVWRGLPAVHTGQGLLVLDEVQPAGKKPMPGKVFLQGARNWI